MLKKIRIFLNNKRRLYYIRRWSITNNMEDLFKYKEAVSRSKELAQ